MLSAMAWALRLLCVLGYVLRLLTMWRVSKLTGPGVSSPPSRGSPIPICKVLHAPPQYGLYVDWAHVDRLSSELCVDWATLLSVSATLN